MKFLRNRGFVILLAVFAVALVGKNLLWPVVRRSLGSRTAAKADPVAAPAPQTPPSKTGSQPPPPNTPSQLPAQPRAHSIPVTTQGVPTAPMDLHSMAASSPGWIASPHRDPFYIRAGIKDGRSARELLTLTGTLQQTASTLAVLNNRVLAAGDSILGFKLEAIENDRVWVTGTNGRESVEFKYIVESVPKEPAQEPLQLAPPTSSLGSAHN